MRKQTKKSGLRRDSRQAVPRLKTGLFAMRLLLLLVFFRWSQLWRDRRERERGRVKPKHQEKLGDEITRMCRCAAANCGDGSSVSKSYGLITQCAGRGVERDLINSNNQQPLSLSLLSILLRPPCKQQHRIPSFPPALSCVLLSQALPSQTGTPYPPCAKHARIHTPFFFGGGEEGGESNTTPRESGSELAGAPPPPQGADRSPCASSGRKEIRTNETTHQLVKMQKTQGFGTAKTPAGVLIHKTAAPVLVSNFPLGNFFFLFWYICPTGIFHLERKLIYCRGLIREAATNRRDHLSVSCFARGSVPLYFFNFFSLLPYVLGAMC